MAKLNHGRARKERSTRAQSTSMLPPPNPVVEQLASSLTVTTPLLPTLDDLIPHFQRILDSRYVTNNGPYCVAFEKKLRETLQTSHALTVTSGTVGLQIALEALVPPGEVITTGFTFPSTYHVLLNNPKWTIRFADINHRYSLDPELVAAQITPKTKAILAVHTYGYPCDLEAFAKLAKQHNLRLIYDAAHVFGVSVGTRPIGTFGDVSVFSLHATKVFNTLEGGCFTTQSNEVARKIRLMCNYGMRGEDDVDTFGVNGKLDEFRSAFGLVTLRYLPKAILARKRIAQTYLEIFRDQPMGAINPCWEAYDDPSVALNYSYFPLHIPAAGRCNRNAVYQALRRHKVLARKYFYPSVTTCDIYRSWVQPKDLPRTHAASLETLCLPIHHKMTTTQAERVVEIIRSVHG